MKKIMIFALAFVLMASVLVGCGTESDTDAATDSSESTDTSDTAFEDQEVFTVNGDPIMLSDIGYFLYAAKSQYEQYYGSSIWDMQATSDMTLEEAVKENLKNTAVLLYVLDDMAEEYDVSLTDDEKDDADSQASSIYESLDPDVIAQYGITLESLENLSEKSTLEQKIEDVALADFEYDEDELNDDLANDSTYTEIESVGVDHYYDSVTARHILLKTTNDDGSEMTDDEKAAVKEKLEGIRERALNGEDFATLAEEYSEDTGSADNGGEYTFSRGEMVQEFEDAAFALTEEGEISDIVETSYGYHIIQLESKTESTEDQIEQAQSTLDSLKENYIDEQKSSAFSDICDQFIEDNGYDVEVNDENWDAYTFKDAEDTTTEDTTTEDTTTEDTTVDDSTSESTDTTTDTESDTTDSETTSDGLPTLDGSTSN